MLIDLLRSRRSIRSFTGQPVGQEQLDLLIEAVLRAPSSKGRAPCEFVVVTDRETIARLSTAKPQGAAFVKDAPLVIVVCAAAEKSDVWVEDAAIAALILHIEALDLGLGSCWVQVRLRDHDAQHSSEEYIAEVLGLGDAMVVEAMIAIGHPASAKPGHPVSSLAYDKVSSRECSQD
ncbi:MAG TPA: nitroreductase family protein [Thermoleophilia bacterium]|nr:nitroreductase family protein [Thermoleophilia bacterium]